MKAGRVGAAAGRLRALREGGSVRELTDGQLLERFATGRGEAAELAFAALVERHGPMVLRVCRGVLRDPHDAQDAFQATFLVLVRKARALWVRDSLGPWLHQVAYRTGLARAVGRRPPAHGTSAGAAATASPSRPPGADRRPGPGRPRGGRPAPRALPGPGGPLRPRRADPRAGGPAPGLAGRDGQEPAVPGAGPAPRPALPPRVRPGCRPARRPTRGRPDPSALLDRRPRRGLVRTSRAIAPGSAALARPGGPPSHDQIRWLKAALGPARPRRARPRGSACSPGTGGGPGLDRPQDPARAGRGRRRRAEDPGQ